MQEVMSVQGMVAHRATALSIWAGRALHKGALLRRWVGSEIQGQGAASMFGSTKHGTGWEWLWGHPPEHFLKYLGLLGLNVPNSVMGNQLTFCLQLLTFSWWLSNLYLQIQRVSPLLECPVFLSNSSYPNSNLHSSQFRIWAGFSTSHILRLKAFPLILFAYCLWHSVTRSLLPSEIANSTFKHLLTFRNFYVLSLHLPTCTFNSLVAGTHAWDHTEQVFSIFFMTAIYRLTGTKLPCVLFSFFHSF